MSPPPIRVALRPLWPMRSAPLPNRRTVVMSTLLAPPQQPNQLHQLDRPALSASTTRAWNLKQQYRASSTSTATASTVTPPSAPSSTPPPSHSTSAARPAIEAVGEGYHGPDRTPTTVHWPAGASAAQMRRIIRPSNSSSPTIEQSGSDDRDFVYIPPPSAATQQQSAEAAAHNTRTIAQYEYHVRRSRNNSLPVYQVRRNHGTRLETRVRHVRGNVTMLAQELSQELSLPLKVREGVWTKPSAGQVIVKGHHMQKTTEFLMRKGF